MNKLDCLENMGFKITWTLIKIGLCGHNGIPTLLSANNVIEYFDRLLCSFDGQTDGNIEDIISLMCVSEDKNEVEKQVLFLANKDCSDFSIQLRKWRAYLLKDLLDHINSDYMQGLLELMEFWSFLGITEDCPHTFPNNNGALSVQEYFTQSVYDDLVRKNREWLDNEILNIVKQD